MQKKIDFTDCKKIIGRAYNGANGKKVAVEYNGEEYMLKFPPSAENKMTELSYSNSCISEHIASSIFNMIGIKSHETMLGTFRVNGKEKIVCACKDFTSGGKKLLDFCSIKNTVLDSESGGTGTELSDILESIEKQTFVDPNILKEHFWDMFVVDALLGNFDRHNGNWGFLYDPIEDVTEIAPVYDCGSCLLPQADEKTIQRILNNREELEARIFHFPTSAIKLNGDKIRYYDFLTACKYEDCNDAVKRIMTRIDVGMINEFIDDVPYITDMQKEFYETYITARCGIILEQTFDNVMEQEQSGPQMKM